MERVLVVDDEPAITDVLCRYLRGADFDVRSACDGEAALLLFADYRPDIVLLDVDLPKRSGLDVQREIRRTSRTPIIMISAHSHEVDRIVGLELGADDYVSKPFSPREVLARVKNVLRRTSGNERTAPGLAVRGGEIAVDRDSHEAWSGQTRLNLTPMEFRILAAFIEHPGQVFTRAQLLRCATNDECDVFDRTLDRHIANLRRKVESDPKRPRHIVTVLGLGYKFVGA